MRKKQNQRTKKIVEESSSDEAPDEVAFEQSKTNTAEEQRNIRRTLQHREEVLKRKRRDIQQRNILQKEEKIKKLKTLKEQCLPKDLLKNLQVKAESDLAKAVPGETVPDFKPQSELKKHKDYLCGSTKFAVHVLPDELKRPIPSSAASFKHSMLYRKEIPRQIVREVLKNPNAGRKRNK